MAASDGDNALVRMLLDAGADADIHDNQGEIALDKARQNGDAATIAMLAAWERRGG